MRVLVTGGAGYIGSVVTEELLAQGAERVVVLDDLSKGHAHAVAKPAILERGDIADVPLVVRLCRLHELDSVIHLAGSSSAAESIAAPSKYYGNNVVKGLALLKGVVAAGVRRIVFSSSAAVYGEPELTPVHEAMPTHPTSPFGETKLAFERALNWYGRAHGLSSIALRYFNAAGATSRNGEQHAPETHLIPIVLDAARGRRPEVEIFGGKYRTTDGTCVRDFVHVSDLAAAHIQAVHRLERLGAQASSSPLEIFNLGSEEGFSVQQVIDVAKEVTGRDIKSHIGPARPGDSAVLLASSNHIRKELGWSPKKNDLHVILADSWKWITAHPNGYV